MLCTLLVPGCSKQPEISPASPKADAKSFEESIEIIGPHLSIELYAAVGDQIWASDLFGMMHYSSNLGESWEIFESPAKERLHFLSVADDGKRVMLVGESGYLYATEDAGVSWRQKDLTALVSKEYGEYWGADIGDIVFDKNLKHGIAIIGCEVFQTSDGGTHWKNRSKALLDDDIENCVERAFMNDQGELDYALVYTDSGYGGNSLFKSVNNGGSWTDIWPHDFLTSFDQVDPICPDDVESPNAFKKSLRYYSIKQDEVPFSHHEIFREKSMSITNELVDKYNMYLEHSAFTRVGQRVWYHSGDNLAYTDNNGEHWNTVHTATPFEAGRVFGTAKRPVYFDAGNYKLLTLDNGKHVTKDISPDELAVRAADFSDTHILYAGTPKGLYSSADFGENWIKAKAIEQGIYTLFVSGETTWALDGNSESLLYWSRDDGANWQYQELPELYLNVSQCNADACLLYNEDKFILASLSKNPSNKQILTVVEHAYALPEDHYTKWVVASPDLKTVSVLTDEYLLMQTNSYGETWQKIDIASGHESVELSQSPNRLSQLLINSTESDDFADDNKKSKLSYLNLNRNSKPQLFAFPEPNSYVDFFSNVCWLNDDIALMTIHRSSAVNSVLTLATTDGGNSWTQTEFKYRYNCVHYPDKILVGNTYLSVKSDG